MSDLFLHTQNKLLHRPFRELTFRFVVKIRDPASRLHFWIWDIPECSWKSRAPHVKEKIFILSHHKSPWWQSLDTCHPLEDLYQRKQAQFLCEKIIHTQTSTYKQWAPQDGACNLGEVSLCPALCFPVSEAIWGLGNWEWGSSHKMLSISSVLHLLSIHHSVHSSVCLLWTVDTGRNGHHRDPPWPPLLISFSLDSSSGSNEWRCHR